MVSACLTRGFSDFVDAHPTPLEMPRGDREFMISWQDPQELVSNCSRCCQFFSG